MQFQVPQFIESEDKIIGPLTLKQFLYLAAAGGISFMLFFLLQIWIWGVITAILGVVAISMAFIRYNGRPLAVIFLAALNYFWKPRFYLWRKIEEKQEITEIKLPPIEKKGEKPSLKSLFLKLTTSVQPIEKREKTPPGIATKGSQSKEKTEIFRKITGEREAARRIDYR